MRLSGRLIRRFRHRYPNFFTRKWAEYLLKYRLAVTALQREEDIRNHESQAGRLELENAECAAVEENKAIKPVRKIIHDDIEDGLKAGNRLEDAYTATMIGRVRVATGAQSVVQFNRKFKADALKYYNAINTNSELGKCSWCHLLGWTPAILATAAHIVPKSLEEESASFLFGAEVKPATDVRNGTLDLTRMKKANANIYQLLSFIGVSK